MVAWSLASSHDWIGSRDEHFLCAAHAVWEREFGVTADDVVKVKTLHQQLRAIENPPVTASVPVKQVGVCFFWLSG